MIQAISACIADPIRVPSSSNAPDDDAPLPPLAGVSCLVVEDGDAAATDRAALEDAGAMVARVRTVQEGLLALARMSYDLLLVAPALPDGSGYQVVAFAVVTRCTTGILIVSDVACGTASVGPFERAFTILEKDRSGDRLVSCALKVLKRTSRSEIRPQHREETPRNAPQTVGFASRYGLSQRQRQVLSLLVGGTSPKTIALSLAVAPTTVRRHAEEIYRKCGVRCQRELLALVARSSEPERPA